MKKTLAFLILTTGLSTMATSNSIAADTKYALAIHGGAGTMTKEKLSPELERAYRDKLREAAEAGAKVLQTGGTALDAVTSAIVILEDSELFNAGKGAVFTAEGKNELDSSIMDGSNLNAGAVAGVTRVKNPILLAKAVMQFSPHVMLQGAGAESFAQQQGVVMVDPSYFYTQLRWQQLQNAKAAGKGATLDHDGDFKFGTVGAVALDSHGNLAAGTSTGGMTNKQFGRIGDSPIIGAGTYANNQSCAVSATGHGEYFIRATVARNICAQMEYGGKTLEQATQSIVMQQLVDMGGSGGVIAVDKDGNISLVFNTEGMYRASVSDKQALQIKIFRDE